jgi:RNA polymerase sigma factor for flagellar operon FliA
VRTLGDDRTLPGATPSPTGEPVSPATHEPSLVDRYAGIFDEDRELAATWVACKTQGDHEAHNRLVVSYAPLVRYVVSRMNIALPASLERQDLVSFGLIGLIDAIDRFDLDRGFTFQTYAVTRIRGAILDELRSLDWVPRAVRGRMHQIEKVTAEFEQNHGSEPGLGDIASATGLEASAIRSTLVAYQNGYLASLDERSGVTSGHDEEPRERAIVDSTAELPDEIFDHQESQLVLRQQIRSLKLRDRAVVALYYFEELTFAEIGRVLTVSESRVCQVHGRAIRDLRAAY